MDEKIAALETQVAELNEKNAALETRVAELEAAPKGKGGGIDKATLAHIKHILGKYHANDLPVE